MARIVCARGDERAVGWLTLLVAPLLAALLLAHGWWLPARAPLNVNEGWNAMQAMRAWGAGQLYADPDGLTANNYPPLSFYIVGGLGRLIGDDVIAGRIVALLAQAATGAAVYAIVTRVTRSPRRAWIGLLLFAGYSATMLRRYTMMNDPQWLAVTAMSWALFLVTRARDTSAPPDRAICAAATLTVIAMFTKHNVVAIPIAITGWLWWVDRRAFRIWAGVGAILTVAMLAAIFARWGATAFVDVLGESRQYSLSRMAAKGGPDLLVLLPALIAVGMRPRADAADAGLSRVLLPIAVVAGITQRSADGVDINAFFEAVVALAIALPIRLPVILPIILPIALPARVPIGLAAGVPGPGARLVLAALPIALLAPVALRDDLRLLTDRDDAVARWGKLIVGIAGAKGAVACDDQVVCYWAGRDAGMDFFILKQRLLRGRGASARAAIAERRFAMIEMRGADTSRHADLLRPLIRAHYRPVLASGGSLLLVPR